MSIHWLVMDPSDWYFSNNKSVYSLRIVSTLILNEGLVTDLVFWYFVSVNLPIGEHIIYNVIKSNKCKQTLKSEAFHENVFGFEQWRVWKNWISAEFGGILDFFSRHKDERGEAERVRDKASKVVTGRSPVDRASIYIKI